MNWLVDTFTSSIGKKLLMAVSGLFYILFLTVHLIGNLTLYGGKDLFNSYAEHLHALEPLLMVLECALVFFAALHILTGLTLFYQNWKARPQRYYKKKRAGGRTIGSSTMPYTGIILLCFVTIHLLNFTFIDKGDKTIFEIVSDAFAQPAYAFFYFVCMVLLAIHVSHGFWSAFQTIGFNHPKYMPIIKGACVVFSLIVGIGFGSIPIFMFLA